MDKTKVKSILAPYSPPLSQTQVEAIAEKIAKVSAEEAKITTKVKPLPVPKSDRKKSRKSKSLLDRKDRE